MGQAASLSYAVCSASSDKPLLLHLIASIIKEGHSLSSNTVHRVDLDQLLTIVLSDWFLNLKLSIFCEKTGSVFFFYLMPWMGKGGRENVQNCHNCTAFACLNCYHNHFRVLSFCSFCLSVLCMHDQGGGMHSKPNLHVPQQGENERERKSKERERLSAKNT